MLLRGEFLGQVVVLVEEAEPLLGEGDRFADELVGFVSVAVVGAGENWWDVVHADDVADAFAVALEKAPPGSLYHVADDAPISLRDFVGLTAEELGVGAPRHIPAPLARLAAGRHAVTAAVRSARTSNARIKQQLSWSPRFRPRGMG